MWHAGRVAAIFLVGYALIPTYSADSNAEKAVNRHKEQAGDRGRAVTSLAYQLVVEVLLGAILTVECTLDHLDWLGDDTLKTLFKVDRSILQL